MSVVQSRRKQAKPRSVKVEEGVYSVPSAEDSSEKMVVSVSAGDLVLFESDQDENNSNASLRGASVCLRGPSGTIEAPIGPLSSIGGAGCLTSAPSVKCDSCGLLCDNLDDFIEHQNTECRNERRDCCRARKAARSCRPCR
ncbi:uncharacterized protein LOC111262591 isoform X2 [Varroa jacobsoni]|uniref:uncharacterized protein LOC111262591 isoform X2 n=1 Tax=Varroa jacobsoni TaxID=62625 RepID=UPI000BF87AF1|nr:uncharacterized protein LOC111262591 isoform X2 [Varroa jacobsoni]